MPRQIDYYFSLSSPWAYIGHKLFREVVATYGLRVNHKPVVLVDLFSETGGLPLVKRHPVRQRYRMLELQRWRDKRGLNFHFQPKHAPFNARLADGLVISAIEAGHDPDPFLRRAFAGVWEDELDLTDAATLVRLADDCGLPGQALVERSATDEIGQKYEQNSSGCVVGRRVRVASLCAGRRSILGSGSDRIAGGRIEIGSCALSFAGLRGGHGSIAGRPSVPIPKFMSFFGATFRTSESKGHQLTY